MHLFPSKEWTDAYKDAVNANDAYRTAGKDWTHGKVAMVIKAQPDVGVETDVGMVLDVGGGTCHGTSYVTDLASAQHAEFVVTEVGVGEHDERQQFQRRHVLAVGCCVDRDTLVQVVEAIPLHQPAP